MMRLKFELNIQTEIKAKLEGSLSSQNGPWKTRLNLNFPQETKQITTSVISLTAFTAECLRLALHPGITISQHPHF